MSIYDPTIAEIMLFGGNFAPRQWAFCDGQLLPINQNQALFSILGTTYGGDGRTTFALPDLRSRVPVHKGTGPGLGTINLGERGGIENASLITANLPSHSHAVKVSSANGNSPSPQSGGSIGKTVETQGRSVNEIDSYNAATPDVTLNSASSTPVGSNQSFSIRNPFLGLNYIIALQGVFPSRN